MRKFLFATVAVISLAASTGAFAQSQQGGYLGGDAGAHQAAATPATPRETSHQGGYLGLSAGSSLMAPRRAAPSLADELADALSWCTVSTATAPTYCRNNAAGDHSICVANPEHYDSCRYAMSQMFHS